jgi:hypothetical protein
MASEEAKQRLGEFVKLNTYDDKYIDRDEEKKILQEAVRIGISVDEGLALMRQTANANGITVERDVEDNVKDMLRTFTRDGQIDKKEFVDAVETYKAKCNNRVPEPEIKRRVKAMIQNEGWKVKEGGLFGSKWFTEIH